MCNLCDKHKSLIAEYVEGYISLIRLIYLRNSILLFNNILIKKERNGIGFRKICRSFNNFCLRITASERISNSSSFFIKLYVNDPSLVVNTYKAFESAIIFSASKRKFVFQKQFRFDEIKYSNDLYFATCVGLDAE